MKKKKLPLTPLVEECTYGSSSSAIHVKTDIHAGDWRCTSCEGLANGSDLIKPKCDYCELQ
jgi:hypothetical protein